MQTPPYKRELPTYMRGTQLKGGRYQIERAIGKGSQGQFYRAWDFSREAPVAIKVSSSDHLRDEGWQQDRFDINGIPRIHALFEENQRFHLVTDYIEGATLQEYIESRGSLSIDEVLKLGIALGEILKVLHTAHPPVVHGDVKPSNIMIDKEGGVYLVDFGIAECLTPSPPRLKRTRIYGTSGYAAPERSYQQVIVPQGDVYSLGATLHQATTGEQPPQGLPGQFFFRPLRGALGHLIMQMLEPKPQRRPSSSTLTQRLRILNALHDASRCLPFPKLSLLSLRELPPTRLHLPDQISGKHDR